MATALKVLGQNAPAATTLTTLYTVPALTQAVVTGVHATNRSATPTSIRVSVAIAGAVDATSQYVSYDEVIGANETLIVGRNLTLGAADVVRCYATLATVSFSAFGQENS